MLFLSILLAVAMKQPLYLFRNFKRPKLTIFSFWSLNVGKGRGPFQGSPNQEPVSQSHAIQPSPA